jgi:hypothetical protein
MNAKKQMAQKEYRKADVRKDAVQAIVENQAASR